MAYGELRVLYDNFISDVLLITLSSQSDGKITTPSKSGSGVATISVTGPFEGERDLTYNLEIDGIAAGTEVGQATFRWKNSETTGAWEETGILTRTSPAYALSADGLNTNISVSHTGKVGVDFAVGDLSQWMAKATYGAGRLIDLDRKTSWKSTGIASENIVFDLGSPQTVKALVVGDHNLSSLANIKLQGNSSDAWGAPTFDSGWLSISDTISLYLSQSFQYWRILIEDPTNTNVSIQIGNLFLGDYTIFEKVNADWGSSQQDGYILQSNQSEAGVTRKYAYAKQRKLSLNFGKTVTNDDIDLFLLIQDVLVSTTTHRVLPLWIHLFYDEADTLNLMEWDNIEEWNHEFFRYLLNSGVLLELSEVPSV